jgi:hypothetical protein
MVLKQLLDQVHGQSKARAKKAILELSVVAAGLDMKETAGRLEQTADRLASDTFQIIVAGRFKNGKSTLLNALLGRTTRHVPELSVGRGPMPVGDLPCTATLTSIRYAEKPSIRAWGFDGSCEEWSLEKYQREGTVRQSENETREFFRKIREFEMGFPAELCQSGVTIIDSPGTNDIPERTEVTRQAINKCDAAIMVYRSDIPVGQDERKFVAETLTGTGTRIFSVINMQDGRVADARFKGAISHRLATDLNSDGGANQDFVGRQIYFVDAKEAEEGKLLSDPSKIEHSGLAAFEGQLGEFLINERQRVHIDRFLKAADNCATTVEQQVRQRQAALQADSEQLRMALEGIQPQLAEVHHRQEQLPEIFRRHRDQSVQEIRTGLAMVMHRVSQTLPDKLNAEKLPSDKGLAVVHQKELMKEAYAFCEQDISAQVLAWCNGTSGDGDNAQKILQPCLEALLKEVQEEVAAIEKQLDEAQYQVSGWTLESGGDQRLMSEKEQMWSTLAGILLLWDFTMVTGLSTGFRGLAFNFGTQIVAAIGLTLLGAPGLLILAGAVGTGMLASVAGGSIGLTQRIKAKVLEDVLGRLDSVGGKLGAQIEQETSAYFDKLATKISGEVLTAIEGKERNLRTIAENNRRSQSEKAKMLSSLEQSLRRIGSLRQELTALNVSLQQSA